MRTLALLLACSLAAAADEPNLIRNGSFEEPAVPGRVDERDGGTPIRAAEGTTSWAHFQAPVRATDKPGGELSVGLTNQYAHTGKQAVFVDFKELGAQRRSFLMTDLLPVKAGQRYRIAIWARIDPKRPLTLDQRRPLLKMDFEYFTADQETQCERVDAATQFIPGSLDRLLFFSNRWTEYFRIVRTPEDAAWMKVSIRWETDKAPGTTDGVIYFDDASVLAIPGGESLAPLDPAAPKPLPADAAKKEE